MQCQNKHPLKRENNKSKISKNKVKFISKDQY